MNSEIFWLGFLQLVLSLTLGVIILFFNYMILYKVIGRRFKIKKKNIAFAIFSGGVLFSVGYLLAGIIQPILATIRLLNDRYEDTQDLILESTTYILTFLIVGMIVSLIVNLVSVAFYTGLTKIKEFEEIAANNIAVGIVTGIIVVTMSILVRDAMIMMVESFIPFPEAPVIVPGR